MKAIKVFGILDKITKKLVIDDLNYNLPIIFGTKEDAQENIYDDRTEKVVKVEISVKYKI